MEISDIVDVNVDAQSTQVAEEGFGTALILGVTDIAGFTERVREYAELTDMTSDGYATTDPEYRAAAKHISQKPRPETFKIGRCANKPTQRWAITPVAAHSTEYAMEFGGEDISITSDANATVTEIIAALKTAIDALGLDVTTSDQTTYLRIVADNAGDWFQLKVADTTRLKVAQDHDDPGVQADLAAIALVDDDWYGIINCFNSAEMVEEIAEYAEANKKFFAAASQDSDITTSATTDIASTLKDDGIVRTKVLYHGDNGDFFDAALLGKCLPLQPGSETWMFKTLAGVTAENLTPSQRNQAMGKNANVYVTRGGVNITMKGTMASGKFADELRFVDWLESGIGSDVYAALVNNNKLPFTDQGIAIIQGLVMGRLLQGVAVGGLAADPAPVVSVPKAANVSTANKAARNLPSVTFTAVLAGAIHKVQINGTVTV